jgi:lipoprotein NlpD
VRRQGLHMKVKGWYLIISLLLFLTACSSRDGLAPVVDLSLRSFTGKKQHVVRKGETLYSIAWRYDKDYRELARRNRLAPPYRLSIGQKINLKGTAARPKTYYKPRAYTKRAPIPKTKVENTKWVRPAKGKVSRYYNPILASKGIDIIGKKGRAVYATKSGRVAYAGDGLPGYGNLIIIKHNQEYLSAYGNNKKNFVKEGQWVKAGDKIAEMGVIGKKKWGLHFEIRKAGRPVNPLNYLKNYV